MRVLMISKALVVGAYQRKCEELARLPGVDLHVVVPEAWQEPGGRRLVLERAHTEGYSLHVLPLAFNGHFHLHYYPGLGSIVRSVKPDIVHIDEEPYNLATWQALRLGRSAGARCLFFTWQNLNRRYPPPWRWLERQTLSWSDYALAGNAEAVDVLRSKGYAGPCAVVPQFGVDAEIYRPSGVARPDRPFTIGFVGRIVEEKGILVLLRAAAQLSGEWRLAITGSGPLQPRMEALAAELGIRDSINLSPGVASAQIPALLHTLDCLVLPSLTRANWKEQFGRILIEAMACQVPVVGSNSGEIPHLIGDAGLVTPEGDAPALAAALSRLRDKPGLRAELSRSGRERVLAHYTQRKVAEDTYAVYKRLAGSAQAG